MRTVSIPRTDLTVSRFIFGTSSLFNAGPVARRRALLDAAVDHGFTHFDTAPYYGFGMAERDLRPVLSAHPEVTVTTKTGLYPPGGADQPAVSIMARKASGRAFPVLSRPIANWNIERARASLEGSLRRLGREQIDLFLLHEPDGDLFAHDEWLAWLRAETAAGRVGRFGVALGTERLASLTPFTGAFCEVIQTADSLDGREADLLTRHGRPLQITYGYVSSAKQRNYGAKVGTVLTDALRRNATGAVIVSTRRVDRLKLYAQVASD